MSREKVGAREAVGRASRPGRDYRLDFFRGLALVCIFIDHIPDNRLSTFTLRSYAFCDAAEVFIFISGFTAAMVYGRGLLKDGRLMCTARIWRRAWQLYVAHLCIFMLYNAEVAYTMGHYNNPLFADELQVGAFLQDPAVIIPRVLLLQFQPSLLNILPVYIILMLVFPLFLLPMRRTLVVPLLASLVIYLSVEIWDLDFPAYPPDTEWYFNPLAYQFLFVLAATFGFASIKQRRLLPEWRWLVPAAVVIVAVGVLVQGSWTLHGLFPRVHPLFDVPDWLGEKSRLAPLRIVSLLSMALIVARLVPPRAAMLTSRLGWPIVLCGQNSLYVFCLTILLSVLANIVMLVAGHGLLVQLGLSMMGLALMIGFSFMLAWFDSGGHLPHRPQAVVEA